MLFRSLAIDGCALCIYQREPYAVAAAVGLLAVAGRASPSLVRLLFIVCAALFAVGGALAALHVATQQGWSIDAEACDGLLADRTMIDLIAAATARARRLGCDAVEWSLFGLSLAGWNLIYSGSLSFACACLAMRIPRHAASDLGRQGARHGGLRAVSAQQVVGLAALVALALLLSSMAREFDSVRLRAAGDVRLTLTFISTSAPALRRLFVAGQE